MKPTGELCLLAPTTREDQSVICNSRLGSMAREATSDQTASGRMTDTIQPSSVTHIDMIMSTSQIKNTRISSEVPSACRSKRNKNTINSDCLENHQRPCKNMLQKKDQDQVSRKQSVMSRDTMLTLLGTVPQEASMLMKKNQSKNLIESETNICVAFHSRYLNF